MMMVKNYTENYLQTIYKTLFTKIIYIKKKIKSLTTIPPPPAFSLSLSLSENRNKTDLV